MLSNIGDNAANAPTLESLEKANANPESLPEPPAADGTDKPTLADAVKEQADQEAEKETVKKEPEVVWPRNFKNQTLPPEIYRKQYSVDNNHLPKAQYHHEVEAHIFYAAVTNNLNGIRALLRTGVPLDIRNSYGETLLMAAVRYGAIDSVRMLLGLGLGATDVNTNGASALHYAVQMGRADMAAMLLQSGAYSNQADNNGISPLQIAYWRNDAMMLQMLYQHQSYQQANGYGGRQAGQPAPIARYMR